MKSKIQGGTVLKWALVSISVVIAGVFARAFCMSKDNEYLTIGNEALSLKNSQGLVWLL